MKERISLALTNRIVNISVTAQNNTLFTHVFHLRETTSLRVENGREQPANVKNRGKNWSRGPPCRLPFAVNVMLNLSNYGIFGRAMLEVKKKLVLKTIFLLETIVISINLLVVYR